MFVTVGVRTVTLTPGGYRLDDAVLGQLVQLQVIEGLPRANDGDVCGNMKETVLKNNQ